MSVEVCPTCGRSFRIRNKFIMPAIVGSIAGFFSGAGFVVYWFGIDAGFFHSMALIHEIAGAFLGLLIGLIIGSMRR